MKSLVRIEVGGGLNNDTLMKILKFISSLSSKVLVFDVLTCLVLKTRTALFKATLLLQAVFNFYFTLQ